MKTPYCRVYVNGDPQKDITEYVDKVEYEDCSDKDPKLDITVFNDNQSDRIGYLLDREDIDEGSTLSAVFGIRGEKMSPVHTLEIKDITTKYGKEGIRLTICAMGHGNAVKRATSKKVWKNKKTADIVAEIATAHGLKLKIDAGTTMSYDTLPQGNMGDMDVVKFLADRETNGNFISYVRNKTLHFVKRGLDQPSQRTYTWGVDVQAFEGKKKTSTGESGAETTEVSGVEAFAKGVISDFASPTTEKGSTTLGDYKSTYKSEFNDTAKRIRKVVVSPEQSKDGGASNLANTAKKDDNLDLLECTITVELDPAIEPNLPVTMANVHRRYLGNWLVDKVKHTVSESAATSVISGKKNGGKDGDVKAGDTNNDAGPKDKKTKVKVNVYDANALSKGKKVVTP